MITVESRFDVRLISSDALARYMQFRGLTVRELADRVGCSRSTIGHLRSGRRTYIRPDWARRIERSLDAPQGSLFVPELSTIHRDIPPIRKAS